MLVSVLACLVCWKSGAAQNIATLIQQVNQAPAPSIVWNAPEPIPFGTPLSALQLNASSAAAGTFVYQPAGGAVLPSGTHTLSVVFSPADQNFQTGSASVSIVVTPPGSSGFTVTPLSANSPESPLTLQPGAPATVPVAVGPIGDFHQPVTLSCKTAPWRRRCVFSPAVIRPTTAPVQVSLTFAPMDGNAATTSTKLLPSMTASALFGLLLFRRRLRTGWSAAAGIVLAFPLLATFAGCGFDLPLRTGSMEKIEVIGSSLVETHIAYVYVTNDGVHFPLLKRPFRHEEEKDKREKRSSGEALRRMPDESKPAATARLLVHRGSPQQRRGGGGFGI